MTYFFWTLSLANARLCHLDALKSLFATLGYVNNNCAIVQGRKVPCVTKGEYKRLSCRRRQREDMWMHAVRLMQVLPAQLVAVHYTHCFPDFVAHAEGRRLHDEQRRLSTASGS